MAGVQKPGEFVIPLGNCFTYGRKLAILGLSALRAAVHGGWFVVSRACRDEGPLDEGPLDEGPLDEGPLDEGPLDVNRWQGGALLHQLVRRFLEHATAFLFFLFPLRPLQRRVSVFGDAYLTMHRVARHCTTQVAAHLRMGSF